MGRETVICDCGSTTWYVVQKKRGNEERCVKCNALIDPFDNRTDFLYYNEQAGYVGTD